MGEGGGRGGERCGWGGVAGCAHHQMSHAQVLPSHMLKLSLVTERSRELGGGGGERRGGGGGGGDRGVCEEISLSPGRVGGAVRGVGGGVVGAGGDEEKGSLATPSIHLHECSLHIAISGSQLS